MFCRLPSSPCYVIGLFTFAISTIVHGAKSNLEFDGWDDIPEDELNATEAKIFPDAHSEFLYRSLKIDDSTENTYFKYHNRAKIYTEAGVKEWDKIDLHYQTGWRVSKIKARVIYPDGTVSSLDRKDIYTRKIYKDENFEGNAKSFSFPGLKPGCIIEYKWVSTRSYWTPSLYIPLLAEFPTRNFEVLINPYGGLASRANIFNSLAAKWNSKRGQYYLNLSHLRPLSDKPYLAPRKDFEPWFHLEYGGDLKELRGEEYWGYRGGALGKLNRDFIKSNQKHIKDLAKQLFENLENREEKLRAAYEYCTNEITNISEYNARYTEEEIEELKDNKSPKDTITRGYGTRYDINALFASLCKLIDLKPTLAMVEDRKEITFTPRLQGSFCLSDWVVTIADGPDRRFFDPGSSFLPFEVLNPENSGANAIITDKKYYYWIETPAADESSNLINRIADVSINEYGDLEGSVELQYKGFSAIKRKRHFVSLTQKEREEYITEHEWQSRLARAKISNLTFKHDNDRSPLLIIKYDLEIPGYSDPVGNRMILNPCLFENGKPPIFVAEKRTEPIMFDFIETIQDKVSIVLPEGFQPEDNYNYGNEIDNAVLQRISKIEPDPDSKDFVYQRLFRMKTATLNAEHYKIVKSLFDAINKADSQPVSYTSESRMLSSNDR